MIDWAEHAETMVARLRSDVPLLATVLHIQDAGTEDNPATLPVAYVIAEKTTFIGGGSESVDAVVTWGVLVRCKRMTDATGALRVAKEVVRSLSGYRLAIGWSPLRPISMQYFREEMRPEPAYLLTFETTADQLPSSFTTC